MFAHAPCSLTNALIQSASNPRSASSNCSRFQCRQQGEDKAVVVRLAGSQCKSDRQPAGIDDCVYLGRQSATRPAHQLFTIASDASSMLMHADDGPINHLHGCIMACGQRIHELVPHASPAPANKAI